MFLIITPILAILWIMFYRKSELDNLTLIMPFINLAFFTLMLVILAVLGTNESTLRECIIRYLKGDGMIALVFIIIPNILIGTVIPLIFIMIKLIKKLCLNNHH